MALTPEQTTRVDQLAADLQRVARKHKSRAGVPDPAPMFTTHADGSVWNRQGVQIYAPRPTGK